MDNDQLRTLYAEFCQDMLEWVQAGMPCDNTDPFSKGVGLCSNLSVWVCTLHTDALCDYQTSLFHDAGLDTWWPFDGNSKAYFASKQGAGLYANEARLQWLRDHADL